jgi:hypothetical protein
LKTILHFHDSVEVGSNHFLQVWKQCTKLETGMGGLGLLFWIEMQATQNLSLKYPNTAIQRDSQVD